MAEKMPGHRSKVHRPAKRLKSSSSSSTIIKSQYVTVLLKKWVWGLFSAQCLHELAVASQMMLPEGHIEPELDEITQCGSRGDRPANIRRDLTRIYCKNVMVPQPFTITVPYLDPKGDKKHAENMQTDIFLVSDWLHTVSNTPGLMWVFDNIFGASDVQKFWDSVDPSNPTLSSTISKRRNWKAKTLPLQLHADGAAFHDRDSLLTVSISGLLKKGTIKESNLILASYPKSCTSKISGSETWKVIWRWLLWDFKNLLNNTWSAVDPWGNAFDRDSAMAKKAGKQILPQGWCATIWNFSADMDYYYEMGCPHFAVTGGKPLCIFCNCNKSDRNWFDFTEGSAWKGQRSMWVPKHPLFELETFTVYNIAYDVLHVLDLGVTSHVIANILFSVVIDSAPNIEVACICNSVCGWLELPC